MRLLIAFLMMTGLAYAGPCDDYKARFKRAKEYGAYDFKCKDQYDGSATSSFKMETEAYRKFIKDEAKRRTKRGKN
jgi:hypothetical protein